MNPDDTVAPMRLLVSVASATEALAALAGGADVIDAKDPLAGALGAVPIAVLTEIHAAVGGAHPVNAAIGDAADDAAIEETAWAVTAGGAAPVEGGFPGLARPPGSPPAPVPTQPRR